MYARDVLVLSISFGTAVLYFCSLVTRPSTPPVFDHLQYAKMEEEGLGNFIT